MEANDIYPNSHTVTTVEGTDGREALPKRWIAALVKVRSEKAVGKKLLDLQIENYVPTQWEIHQWSDRRKKVERVVIPMVVFIHAEKGAEKRLITYSFIHKLLSYTVALLKLSGFCVTVTPSISIGSKFSSTRYQVT